MELLNLMSSAILMMQETWSPDVRRCVQGALIYMHSKKHYVFSTSAAEAELYAASGRLTEGLRVKH